MADIVISDSADKLVAPQAWSFQARDQQNVDVHAARLATFQAELDATKQKIREVFAPIIQRAGGSLAPGQQITGVTVAQDGTVTVTYS